MIITNIDVKEYQGAKSYYATIDGKRAKLKGFSPEEIKEGADLQGELKAWSFNGKNGFNFWKGKPKTNSNNQIIELLTEIRDLLKSKEPAREQFKPPPEPVAYQEPPEEKPEEILPF